ncbi:MAG: methylmalonyl-CoA epimerase [Deltaproteobacteria bacterium]|nr:MAG: methylmalonyl-CoA epimerase [Deltaproteobacteria bacterium]
MILSLDHIAIAVPDLEKAIERWGKDFGLTLAGTEDVETAKTSTAFFPVPGTRIELVHPLRGTGPIVKYLEKRGGGMHHLCFAVDDIRAEMSRLQGLGYRFLSEEPSIGAHESLVVFIHPKSTDGVLVELVQHTQDGH